MFKKLEEMLEHDLANKTYQLLVEEICPVLNALAHKKCMNETIWQVLLTDIDKAIKLGLVSNI
jgi:hypothetical protein